jgi:hypothetical protein
VLPVFFGRPYGVVRMILALAGVGVLALLTFVVLNLNNRLDNQQRANLQTLAASQALVSVNNDVTDRLAQLTALTSNAGQAVHETQSLAPLLVTLREVIAPAAAMIHTGSVGGQVSNAQLTAIEGTLAEVRGTVVPLVSSARAFGGQGQQLVGIVQGLVSDLRAAVSDAETINRALPLPG